MNSLAKKNKTLRSFGFTLIEVMVVVVVIGILALITVVSYNAVVKYARDTTLRSDLSNAAKLIQAGGGGETTSFPSTIKTSPDVGLSLSYTGNPEAFCINGQMTTGSSTTYMYYDSVSASIKAGACSGKTVFESEYGGMPKNYVKDDAFSLLNDSSGWILWTSSTNDPLTVRAGTASDPIPNKPVLVITNATARTVTWMGLAGPVDWANLQSGLSYKRSVWIRKIGSFTGGIYPFAVNDDDATNYTLSGGDMVTITSSWSKVSRTSSAFKNGNAGNLFISSFSEDQFSVTGWTLEIQDPQLIKV